MNDYYLYIYICFATYFFSSIAHTRLQNENNFMRSSIRNIRYFSRMSLILLLSMLYKLSNFKCVSFKNLKITINSRRLYNDDDYSYI